MSDNIPLPPLPDPPSAFLVLFSPGQWNWLSQATQLQYLGQQATLMAIGELTQVVGNLASVTQELQKTMTQFQDDLDRNTASTNAAVTAMQTEVQQVKDLIAQLSTSQPPTQAQLDQLNASTDKLDQATAILVGDDSQPSQSPSTNR